MRFSIITCTYNSAAYLQENIDSVKSQTFDDFEHIFIDGFSADGTVEMINRYQEKFPGRVRLFQSNPKGIADAMNRGIENARGEYIIHMHSDDSFYDSAVLKKVSNFIEAAGAPDLVYGKAKFINDTGSFRIIPHRKIYQKFRHWLLLLTNYIPHQATFIKKSIFENHGGFDEQYKNSMDYEMWLRLSKLDIRACFFDSILCNFSMRADSQSTTGSSNSIRENIRIQEKYVKSHSLRTLLKLIAKTNSRRTLL
jgi:glycosyltransferase involved in cell wall biosynthesis